MRFNRTNIIQDHSKRMHASAIVLSPIPILAIFHNLLVKILLYISLSKYASDLYTLPNVMIGRLGYSSYERKVFLLSMTLIKSCAIVIIHIHSNMSLIPLHLPPLHHHHHCPPLPKPSSPDIAHPRSNSTTPSSSSSPPAGPSSGSQAQYAPAPNASSSRAPPRAAAPTHDCCCAPCATR